MRTMLIAIILVLICSQYATAGGFKIEDCGGEQKPVCVVPSMCIKVDGTTLSTDLKRSKAYQVTSFVTIDKEEQVQPKILEENCPVIFRLYSYNPRWIHVEMEFLALAKKAKKDFTFRQFDNSGTVLKNEFSCEINGMKKTAKRKSKGQSLTPDEKNMIDTPGTETDQTKCVFDVRSTEKDIFGAPLNDKFQFQVGTDKSDPAPERTVASALETLMCNPEKLKFYPNSTTLKVYSKVQYTANNPGKYYCDNDKIFKMEFRPKLENNLRGDYEEVDSKGVVCKLGDYFINEPANDDAYKPFNSYDPIHIRCVADAKYFCNYNIRKMTGKRGLVLTSSKPESQLESKLECPKGSNLVLRGKVVDTPKIECLDYENAQYWTLKTGDHTHLLTPDFADAYCTNELKCNQKAEDKIRLVEQGSVDHNGLPKCPPDGKLQIDGKEINAPTCNMKTGKFEYTFMEGGGAPQVADSQTKFLCYFLEATPLTPATTIRAWKLTVVFILTGIALGAAIVAYKELFTIKRAAAGGMEVPPGDAQSPTAPRSPDSPDSPDSSIILPVQGRVRCSVCGIDLRIGHGEWTSCVGNEDYAHAYHVSPCLLLRASTDDDEDSLPCPVSVAVTGRRGGITRACTNRVPIDAQRIRGGRETGESNWRTVAVLLTAIHLLLNMISAVLVGYLYGPLVVLVWALFALVVPVLGLSGLGCKSTCLVMTYIVFAIICAVLAPVGAGLNALPAYRRSTEEGRHRLLTDWDYVEYAVKEKRGLSHEALEREAIAYWASAVVALVLLPLLIANVVVYFKVRRDYIRSARPEVEPEKIRVIIERTQSADNIFDPASLVGDRDDMLTGMEFLQPPPTRSAESKDHKRRNKARRSDDKRGDQDALLRTGRELKKGGKTARKIRFASPHNNNDDMRTCVEKLPLLSHSLEGVPAGGEVRVQVVDGHGVAALIDNPHP